MAEREIQAKRIMLSAPKSGSGKTTLTCALLEVLKRRELSPLSFKCGPDYIDPLFHRQVLGIESYNLDTFFSGRQGVCEALADCGEKYVVAEGVMGLYDGMDASGLMGSCYEIAGAAGIPTVLVVDASKVGRTVISLIKGVLMDDEEHLIKGIILNRISEGFYESLKPVLEEELLKTGRAVSLLGYFPKREELFISSRHLGLYLPEEIAEYGRRIYGRLGVRAEIRTAYETGTDLSRESAEAMKAIETIKTMEEEPQLQIRTDSLQRTAVVRVLSSGRRIADRMQELIDSFGGEPGWTIQIAISTSSPEK